jgi:hypothetical protein
MDLRCKMMVEKAMFSPGFKAGGLEDKAIHHRGTEVTKKPGSYTARKL